MVENFYYAKKYYTKSFGQKYIQIDVTSKVWYDFCKWVLYVKKNIVITKVQTGGM